MGATTARQQENSASNMGLEISVVLCIVSSFSQQIAIGNVVWKPSHGIWNFICHERVMPKTLLGSFGHKNIPVVTCV